jgi:paraquat-inducible protein A
VAALIACHECDLLQRLPELQAGGTARCLRCGAILHRQRPNSLERSLALTLTGLMLLGLANAFPFLAFKLQAQVRQTTLITGIIELYSEDMQLLAILVLLTTIVVPLAQLVGMLYVLLPLRFNRLAPKAMTIFRWVRSLQPWSMTEVFMMGILVSVVKLAKMAKIVPGIALFSFLALIFVLAAQVAALDPHVVWERWEQPR